jgi:cell division protein FtsB
MKLEIDTEVAQGIVISMLNEDIDILENEIAKLKKIKKRKEHQNRELQHSLLYLDAIKQTRYYYGGIEYKI